MKESQKEKRKEKEKEGSNWFTDEQQFSYFSGFFKDDFMGGF